MNGRVASCLPILGLLAACGSVDATPEQYVVPSSAHFDSVARTLDAHCGTLDCHGSTGRNLRLFGYSGMRLDPRGVSGVGATTPLEAGADYCSVTGLEPEILERVATEGGTHPERLTLVRKARGSEEHVGKTIFPEGSPGDRCLTEWIAGQSGTLATTCDVSLGDLRDPPPPTGGTVDLSACNSPRPRVP